MNQNKTKEVLEVTSPTSSPKWPFWHTFEVSHMQNSIFNLYITNCVHYIQTCNSFGFWGVLKIQRLLCISNHKNWLLISIFVILWLLSLWYFGVQSFAVCIFILWSLSCGLFFCTTGLFWRCVEFGIWYFILFLFKLSFGHVKKTDSSV